MHPSTNPILSKCCSFVSKDANDSLFPVSSNENHPLQIKHTFSTNHALIHIPFDRTLPGVADWFPLARLAFATTDTRNRTHSLDCSI